MGELLFIFFLCIILHVFLVKQFLTEKEMNKQKFESPRVIRSVQMNLEQSILTASVADTTTIETTGQEVVEYGAPTADPSTFNHEWY